MITDEQLDLWGKKLYSKLSHGNEEKKDMLEFIRGLHYRTTKNNDSCVVWCGNKNMAKSSGAIVSSIILRHLGLKFDMSHIFYGEADLEWAAEAVTSNMKSVFVFDEMIDFAYTRDAMTTSNKTLVKIITKARKLNHVIFMCIPQFSKIDGDIRNNVNFWLEMCWKSDNKIRDKRFAVGAVIGKDLNPLVRDPWGLDDIKARKKKLFDPLAKMRFMERMRGFLAWVAFPPLPKVIEEEYEAASRAAIVKTGTKFVEDRAGKVKKPKKERLKAEDYVENDDSL